MVRRIAMRCSLVIGIAGCGRDRPSPKAPEFAQSVPSPEVNRPDCNAQPTVHTFEELITPLTSFGTPMKMQYTLLLKDAGTKGEWRICNGTADTEVGRMLELPPDEYLFRVRWYDDQRTRVEIEIDSAKDRQRRAAINLSRNIAK